MGIEFFLLIVIFGLAVAAFLFFSGSFGLAKAGGKEEVSGERPTHSYVEDATKAKTFGADSSDHVRTKAEGDPSIEVRD